MAHTANEILAAFAGTAAVPLNVLPGLDAGHFDQRCWKAWKITSALQRPGLPL
ncbi:MAG: hypothetical protein VYE46_03155 [Cyanobacteriota bacterium]|nr:hypothetical protein [Cyanobacteriota bacterium]